MAKQNKKERKLAAREKHKNNKNSKSQENDSTDDPDLEKQLDRINLKLSYGFHNFKIFIIRDSRMEFLSISQNDRSLGPWSECKLD